MPKTLWSAVAVLVVAAAPLFAGVRQWTVSGPEAGSVTAMASHPSGVVYAALFDGLLFKSADSGATWSVASNGLTDLSILSLAVDPTNANVAYAGTQLGAVFKTTDGGASWSQIGTGLPPTTTVEEIAIDRNNPSTLYAAISVIFLDAKGGVYKSTNGGATWTAMNNGILAARIDSVAIDPSNSSIIWAGCNYRCESDIRLYKSTNAGASWTGPFISQEPFAFIYDVIVGANSTALVLADLGGVYRSTNGGTSWTRATGLPGFSSGTLLAADAGGSNVYWGGANGVYRSTNGGTSFSAATGIPTGARGRAFAFTDAAVIAGTDGDGAFRSTNSGAAWTAANNGLRPSVRALAADPNNAAIVWAGTTVSHLFRSPDNGASWTRLKSGLTPQVDAIAVDPTSSNTVYAGTGGGNGFYKTTNGGTTWTSPSFLLGGSGALAVDPSAPTTLYAERRDVGLQKSTNGGTSWTTINNGLNFAIGSVPRILDIDVDPINTANVYAVISAGGIAKSSNRGTDWTKVTSPNALDLAVSPHTPGVVFAASSSGILKSADGGANWQTVNSGVTFSVAVDPINSSNVYAGTGSGVLRSTDGGATWSALGEDAGMRNVLALAVDKAGNTVYAGTAAGVYWYQFTQPPFGGRRPGRR
jgi:photosystem II stability/assembly factor-like uncharacterized protein